MPKFTLDTDFDYDFQLIGMACHESEYRLCAFLNRELGFNFIREKPLEIKSKKLEMNFNFSLFCSADEGAENSVYLINNKSLNISTSFAFQSQNTQGSLFNEVDDSVSAKFLLIPEKSEMDYFLMLNGEFSENWINMFLVTYDRTLKIFESCQFMEVVSANI